MQQPGWTIGKALGKGLLIVALAAGLILALRSFQEGGIFSVFLDDDLSSEEKLARIREYFESFGAAAPLAYLMLVLIEVVVPAIPGAILYAPGGVVFGGFWGGLLALIGNVLGAAISFLLMRIFGERWRRGDSTRVLRERIARHGLLVIFLLRVNPLTSSDLVSYAAGLTPIPLWKVCLGTALGMAPLCWAQAYIADQLLSALPQLLYPLLALCALYVLVVIFVTWRLLQVPAAEESAS